MRFDRKIDGYVSIISIISFGRTVRPTLGRDKEATAEETREEPSRGGTRVIRSCPAYKGYSRFSLCFV